MTTRVLLSASLRDDYATDGYVVLNNLIPLSEIAALKAAALEIVDDFDIDQHRSVFSTTDRDRNRDDYFFTSAEAVHCFLEEEALDDAGQLTKAPHQVAEADSQWSPKNWLQRQTLPDFELQPSRKG